mgnify:CR=1 FL=1
MTPAEFEREWARCSHWIEAALRHGADHTSLEDVKEAIVAGHMYLWPAVDAAIVTQVVGSRRKECNLYLGGGSMATIERMIPVIEDYARSMGCEIMTVTGRRGWERTFLTKTAGYRPTATLYGKAL